jgi:hypothetical protein
MFDELLMIGVEERYQDPVMAAVWADQYRSETANTGPWHYINIHFRTDGKPVTMKSLNENVVWATSKFRKQLANPRQSGVQRAEAFRWVLHLVADAHQPLHNVARDTDRSPEGDRGGNEFAIKPGKVLPDWNTNLHRVWDSGVGAFDIPMRAGEPGADEAIEELADRIEAEYPMSKVSGEVKDLDPNNWIKEGYNIATRFAYTAPEGGTPSVSYVKIGQEICMKRAALAGYRLAAILNELLKG